ncbi:hypothetical protein FACS18942_03010 [Planctomycetales bacterium]|nr:hypothetical protein FACS18942_03010 [Planctomycetales bacterium]
MDIFERFGIDRNSFGRGVLLCLILYSPFFFIYAVFGIVIGIAGIYVLLSNFSSIIYWFFTNAAGYAVLAAIGLGLFLGWLRDKKPSEPDKQPDNKYDSFFETYTETTTWRS